MVQQMKINLKNEYGGFQMPQVTLGAGSPSMDVLNTQNIRKLYKTIK